MPSYNVKPSKHHKRDLEAAVEKVIEDRTAIEESAKKIAALAKEEDKPEIEEEFVSVAALASRGREALVAKLREHMAKSAPKEYVPPPPTERQRTRTEMEQEAGRRAVARAAERDALQRPKPEASDGYTVPVYRPGDSVPGFESKDPAYRVLK